MLLRRATLADLDAVTALVRRIVPLMRASGNHQWNDDYPDREVFRRDVDAGQLWVAEVDGRLAGFAAITEDQSEEYAHAGMDTSERAIVVHRLAVDPDFRGQGAAAALMGQAEAVAVGRSVALLRVDTNTENAATRRLFPKLGYALVGGEIELAFRPGLRFLCYEKRLPGG